MSYQGTFASIVHAVISKVRLDIDQDTNDVKTWVNLAYLDVVQQTEALQKTSVAAMTTDVDSYLIPSGVMIIKRLNIIYADGTLSNPMEEVTLEAILARRQTDSQVPQLVYDPIYARMGQTQIEIWPRPMAGQSLRFYYVYAPPPLVNDGDVPLIIEPFGSKLLELFACVEAARFKKDILILGDMEQALEYWLNRYQSFLNRSNIIHQFPINERRGSTLTHDPSVDNIYNWR